MSRELGALRRPGYVDGIDVSSVQPSVDWDRVAAAGFEFAIVKVSEGVGGLDPRRLDHLAGARAAGLATGVYHVARVGESPLAQVMTLWDAMGDTMPFRAALDLEVMPDGTSREAAVEWTLRFIEEAERWFGRPPLLYTYPYFIRRLMPLPAEIARCPLWIAHYASVTEPWIPPEAFRPFVPAPWSDWTLHQYSGNGGYCVPGVLGDCDRNLFNGDTRAFRELCGFSQPVADDVTRRA